MVVEDGVRMVKGRWEVRQRAVVRTPAASTVFVVVMACLFVVIETGSAQAMVEPPLWPKVVPSGIFEFTGQTIDDGCDGRWRGFMVTPIVLSSTRKLADAGLGPNDPPVPITVVRADHTSFVLRWTYPNAAGEWGGTAVATLSASGDDPHDQEFPALLELEERRASKPQCNVRIVGKLTRIPRTRVLVEPWAR